MAAKVHPYDDGKGKQTEESVGRSSEAMAIDTTGVSLMFLMSFVKAYSPCIFEGRSFQQLTTKEIVDYIVRPATATSAVSYVDFVREMGTPLCPCLSRYCCS